MKVINHGYSVRGVVKIHKIAYSLLRRAIATAGEIKIRSEAQENNMALHMNRWGYPARLDLLRSMVCAIVEDRKRRNLECASKFFLRMLDPVTAV